jgi:translation initiation factor 2 alpha subunit (eIF-2alpha)
VSTKRKVRVPTSTGCFARKIALNSRSNSSFTSGYIDLSKRRVDPEDVAKCEERYNKAKAVHSVLRHVADMEGKSLETLYQTVGWPMYKKYGHAYDAFKLALK